LSVATTRSLCAAEPLVVVDGMQPCQVPSASRAARRRQQFDRRQPFSSTGTRQQQSRDMPSVQDNHRSRESLPVGSRHWSRCPARRDGLGVRHPLKRARGGTSLVAHAYRRAINHQASPVRCCIGICCQHGTTQSKLISPLPTVSEAPSRKPEPRAKTCPSRFQLARPVRMTPSTGHDQWNKLTSKARCHQGHLSWYESSVRCARQRHHRLSAEP